MSASIASTERDGIGHHLRMRAAAAFDALHTAGREAVLTGTHRAEGAPELTGRWGTSVVLLAAGDLAAACAELTAEVASLLGDNHWQSGAVGRAHATVRALEPFGHVAREQLDRYAAAMTRAIASTDPLSVRFTGLCLSPGGVMACAEAGTAGPALRQQLAAQLGPDGWLEDSVFPSGRDPVWYITLLHYAGPIRRPQELADWVDARRTAVVGAQEFTKMSLCQWSFDGSGMAPEVVATAPFRSVFDQTAD